MKTSTKIILMILILLIIVAAIGVRSFCNGK